MNEQYKELELRKKELNTELKKIKKELLKKEKEIETKINDTDKVQVVDENGKLAVVHLPKGYKIEDCCLLRSQNQI